MNEQYSYLIMSAAFLAPCLIAFVWVPPRPRRQDAAALGITVVVTCALTAVFDSLMIAAGLFTYSPERISGLRIGLAPIEDFAYPIAAALACSAAWRWLTRPRRTPAGERS